MRRLLLIEDEDVIRRALKRLLERKQFRVTDVDTIEAAEATPLKSFDVVLVDLRLPGAPGTDIIDAVAPTPVVVMTSHASVRSAVDVMQTGASDYIAKPFDHDELLLVLERAMQRDRLAIRVSALERDLAQQIASSRCVTGTTLESLAMSISGATATDGAASESALRCFLHGPPGSGREGVARAVHAASAHAEGPLIVLDVASADDHVAVLANTQEGAPESPELRAARHGTLVIRYPELIGADMQEALAHRLDADHAHLCCISSNSLDQLVLEKRLAPFFASLFNAEQQHKIPALSERPDDVIACAQRVAELTARRYGRPAPTLDVRLENWLRTRPWPGEVPELEALIAMSVANSDTATLNLSDLAGTTAASGSALSLDEYFRWFVEFHQSSLSETELASRLGISRKALWERRQRSGLLRPTE